VADPCARRGPLIRAGLTQDSRRLPELARDHFLPDERDLADLVLFGGRFAREVRYYDPANVPDGDWTEFFESDLTASLAALAKLPVESFRLFQADLEAWLKAEPGRAPAEVAAHAKLWFHLPIALLTRAGTHHARLPAEHPLHAQAIRLAAQDLAQPLADLAGWHKGALQDAAGPGADILDGDPLDPAAYNLDGAPADSRLRLNPTVAEIAFGGQPFAAAPVPEPILSGLPVGGWPQLYAATPADPSPYLDAAGAANREYEQIYDALSYNLLSSAVARVYQALERLRQEGEAALAASLEDFGSHAAHHGLWLAFLQLFRHARDAMNGFTGRHLDYYLQDVLRLAPRAPVPDKAHLVFELAKGREAHLLPAGTLFRGGNDALGHAVAYALESDIVVSRARLAEMRGVFIEAGGTAAQPTRLPRAAPVVASRDGLGEVELAEDDPAFPPFGPADSPPARVGFAVADRKLFLREGSRRIVLRAELTAAVADTTIAAPFLVRLSGAEGWVEKAGAGQVTVRIDNAFVEEPEKTRVGSKRKTAKVAGGGKAAGGRSIFFPEDFTVPKPHVVRLLEIDLALTPEDPAIVPLDPELHGTEHAAGVPVAEVLLDFAAATAPRAYAVLRDVRFERVTVRAEASGLRDLMVIADGAEVDPAKPLAPFGARPRVGSALTIGSSEIFSKPIEALRLTLDWQIPYSVSGFFRKREASDIRPDEQVLSGGQWLPAGSGTQLGFGETNYVAALAGADVIDGLAEQTLENPPLTTAARTGFLRMVINEHFGHETYVRENTRALIALAGGTAYAGNDALFNFIDADPGTALKQVPLPPYDPVLTRIEAAYETLRESAEGFALLHPFGVTEGTAESRLLPALPEEGALHLGVADLRLPARLTLLVQVADGTGDPLLPVPELEFAYLDGDAWVPLSEQDVDDKTANVTTSGVLGVNLPEAAGSDHRVLPSGLVWLRLRAPSHAAALNRLLSVEAQAARVMFMDQGNDPAFLATPLPAESIGKLVVPDPAIKKIRQPFASFGGRPAETRAAMDVRVSERLRHKDRAIAAWDVEALVLEAFPALYRVKCLGITELKRDAAGVMLADNELMPGAVTVVGVPFTHGDTGRDPLRPYTDQATLAAVDSFLRGRLSPFVRLEVTNPKLEEVQVDFKVRFRPQIGDIAFYMDALNTALVGFLTPWSQPGGGEITFGGKLWKSAVIDFLDEQPEVDFVTEVRLYHKPDIAAADGAWTPIDVELIEATTSRSILVSARSHVIAEAPA
jgi:hypothetical protein